MTSTVLLWSSFLKKDIPVIHRKTVNWMQLNLGLKSIWLQQTLKLAKKKSNYAWINGKPQVEVEREARCQVRHLGCISVRQSKCTVNVCERGKERRILWADLCIAEIILLCIAWACHVVFTGCCFLSLKDIVLV